MSVANDNASSHGGSASGSSLIQLANNGREDNDAGATSSFWHGCFGTLYTVNKERRTSVLFFIFKYTMEFLQLIVLMLGAQYGWKLDTSTKAWEFVEFLQVRPFATEIGHGLFVVFFIAFLVLLVACLSIYIWVYYCFQNNKFDYVWPLRLVRLFGSIFFEALDLMAMSLMLIPMDCRYYGWAAKLQMYNNEFPTLQCMDMPSVVYLVVGALGVILFITLAGFNKLAQMDLNPATTVLDAYGHPGTELWGFGIKMLMVMAGVFLGDYRHLAIFWLICSVMLCYFFWKWEPMVVTWANYIRMGTFTSVVYVSCIFMVLQFPGDAIKAAHRRNPLAPVYLAYVKSLEIALIGIIPAFFFGVAASFFRLRFFRVTVVNRFKAAAANVKARSIYKFTSPREVEIVSRCCRIWIDCDELQPEAIALAERVLKTGLSCLPNSSFMIIWYTSFLVDVQGSLQSGFAQLQVALKLDPSFIDKYAIFSREQDHEQRVVSDRNGGRGQGNVLSDVEFQKNYRLVSHAHKEALLAMRYFWQLLVHGKVCFEDLTRATRDIDVAVKNADRTYRSVLQRHTDKPRLLRLYAKFLERVKHDPWSATRWVMEAEKLEQMEEECRHTNILGLDEDGGDIGTGRISLFSVGEDGLERALCVFNAHGMITMTNEAMRDMFGYAKAELKGKSFGVLMPPPFSEQQLQQVSSFVLNGRGTVVSRTSDVVVCHKDRSMFAARITVVRISGIGQDSTFLASLEVAPAEVDTATVWVLASGQVLSVDAHFCDWFGHRPADLEGGSTAALTPSAKQLDEVLKSARRAMIMANQAAFAAAAEDAQNEDQHTLMSATSNVSQNLSHQADAIAQSLAAASSPPTTAAEWVLEGTHIHHKFADPIEVDIKVTNTPPSAFSMHVMSIRRAGATAAKPMRHMLVTSPAGAVLHVTDSFASLLGTTSKVLGANGSNNAMEALMVQPFGMIHRAGLTGSMPAQQPPSYSCRSGLSILMPVLGRPAPDAAPVKMQMKKRQGLDEVYHVSYMEITTWEQALDERSLRLVVDDTGVIRAVGDSPVSLFGFNPAILIGQSLSCCIAALRGAGPCQTVLVELAARTEEAPGSSWRVGVGLGQEDVDAAVLASALGGSAPILKQTKIVAAVLTVTTCVAPRPVTPLVEVAADADAAAAPVKAAPAIAANLGYELRLWRADMVTSVVEVDGNGLVVEGDAYLTTLYPAGAALGVGLTQMLGHHIRDYIPLGEHKYEELFDDGAFPAVPVRGALLVDPSKKKSNIKTVPKTAESRRVGPPVLLHGRNRLDGLEVDLSVQVVRKASQGTHLVIHLVNPHTGVMDLNDVLNNNSLFTVDIAGARRSTRRPSVDIPQSVLNAIKARESQQQAPAPTPTHKPLSRHGSVNVRGGGVVGALLEENVAAANASAAAGGSGGGGAVPDVSGGDLGMQVPSSTARRSRMGVVSHSSGGSNHGSGKHANVSSWVMSEGSAYTPGLDASHHAEGSDEDDLGLLSHHVEGGNSDDGSGRDGGKRPSDDGAEGGGSLGEKAGGKGGRGGGGRAGGGGRHSKHAGSDSNEPDEADTAMDEEAVYRRGQRFKKLDRMLNSPLVTAHIRQFKWHTLFIIAVLACASIAAYAAMNVLVKQQITSVTDLDNMGQDARKIMRVAVSMVDLAMMYQPYPNTFVSPLLTGLTGSAKDLTSAKTTLLSSLNTVSNNTLGAYAGYEKPGRMPIAYGLRALWETPTTIERTFFRISANESTMSPTTFVAKNVTSTILSVTAYVSLFDGINKMTAYARDVYANGDWYNTSATAMVGKNRWIDWPSVQYVLNNTDTTYISAMFATLDGYAQVVIGAAMHLNNVQMIILVVEGIMLSILAEIYMYYLCNKVDNNRHKIYSVFVVVPLALVRNLATQRVSIDDAGAASDDEMDDIALLAGVKATSGPPRPGTTGHDGKGGASGSAAGGGGGGKGVHINIAGEGGNGSGGNGGAAAAPQVSLGRRLLNGLLFWRNNKVAVSERRTLTRSMRGVLWLTWPFLLWGVLIILFNELGREKLSTVHGPIMTFNIVHAFQCRCWKIEYATQLLQFSTNYAASAADLALRLYDMELEYAALLFGHAGVPDQTAAHFTLVTQGISNTVGPGQAILYDMTGCFSPTSASCLAVTDPFYQFTVHGFDMLVRHTFDVVNEIVQTLKNGVAVSINGPELQFIWKTRSLLSSGAVLLVNAYKTHVEDVYNKTLRLQMVALIITLVFVVVYLIFFMRPYLAEVSAETRRITELLAQLPIEIDVEGLVQRALLNARTNKPSEKTSTSSAAAAAAVTGPGGLPRFESVSASPLLPPGRGSTAANALGRHGAANQGPGMPSILSLSSGGGGKGGGAVGKLSGKLAGQRTGLPELGSSNSMDAPFLRSSSSIPLQKEI